MQLADGWTGLRSAVKSLLPRTLVVRRLAGTVAPSVLLTFDDGPHPEVTPAVLDRMDAYGARAVFFVVGNRVKRAAHLLHEIRRRGHLLGNHSYLHHANYMLTGTPQPRFGLYYRDLQRCQEVVEHHTGDKPRLFRPPGGRLTPVTLLVPKLLGLRCVTWSVDVGDWRFRSEAEAGAGGQELLRLITPGDIVLLHDDNPSVLDLLDILLPGLQGRRYDLGSGINAL